MTTHADLKFKAQLYHYAATVTDVYDGDTMTVDLDLGLGLWRHQQKLRLWKINAPEIRGPEHEQGVQVRDIVRQLVLNRTILVRTILDKRGQDKDEKYGRLLAEILVEVASGETINLNEMLLAQGLVRPMSSEGSNVIARGESGPLPAAISCPYCGEQRTVEPGTGQVAACPNCLDPAYPL